MSILDSLRTGVISFLFPDWSEETRNRVSEMQERRDYREGRHKQQIKPKPGKSDDNVYINFSGLVIDRSISMLFGDGVEFDLPGEGDDTPEDKYINQVWDKNKRNIFLHRMALLASEDGTGYVKIVEDGIVEDKVSLPRLVLIDPKWVTMDTNPEDFEEVIRYTIRFNTVGPDGKELARKQIHEYQDASENWSIEDWQASSATAGKWELMQSEIWEHNFAQIIHFQNLPSAENVYGTPDLPEDLIRLQDKLNFVVSNINKIIRLYAHPKSIAYGVGSEQKDVIDTSAGELIIVNQPEAFWKNVEMKSDLNSSNAFFRDLRQAFFDVARTVDIDSVADKLGGMTNFGLRVLYQDSINKVKTKQKLYGDAILEINRRLLIINGMDPDPGKIIWQDLLPVNGVEFSNELQMDIEMGILSKQTASGFKEYEWEQEKKRIDAEHEIEIEFQKEMFKQGANNPQLQQNMNQKTPVTKLKGGQTKSDNEM